MINPALEQQLKSVENNYLKIFLNKKGQFIFNYQWNNIHIKSDSFQE
jgi:hypothetical protein